jgi:hypothetical protein
MPTSRARGSSPPARRGPLGESRSCRPPGRPSSGRLLAAGARSPGHVQMLVGQAGVLQQHFLGPRARRAQSLAPRCRGSVLEERERARRVDRPAPEVPRRRASTSAAVAQRSAPTAGESEARVASQEEQAVGTTVPVKASKDGQFTCSTSGHERVHCFLLPRDLPSHYTGVPRAVCGCSQGLAWEPGRGVLSPADRANRRGTSRLGSARGTGTGRSVPGHGRGSDRLRQGHTRRVTEPYHGT